MAYVSEKKIQRSRNSRHLTMPAAVWDGHDRVFADFRKIGADMREGDLVAAAVVLFLDQPRDVQIKLIQRGRAFDLERLQKQEDARDEARADKDLAVAREADERVGQRKRKTPA